MRDQKPRGVPMDEWLLAEMLANMPLGSYYALSPPERVAASEGFYGITSSDFMFPHHHAAGAALRMALAESDS